MENNFSPSDLPQPLNTSPVNIKSPQTSAKILIVFLSLITLILAGTIVFLIKRPNVAFAPVQPTENLETKPSLAQISPAVMDTTNWATYTDTKIGYSFKYPKSVLLNSESKATNQLVLTVSAEKLADIPEDLPLMMGRNDALAEKALLAKGEGDGLVKIGSINGQSSTTLAQFEVCSVMFLKKLNFYPGEYRVRLTLVGPTAKIVADMPDFFQVDSPNCGSELVWNQTKMSQFEPKLIANQGNGMAQTWHDTFNQILTTIRLTPPTNQTEPTPSAKPAGSVYLNEQYNFELTYPKPYKVLTSKADLYGYPNGLALLYTGGQAYDIIIEAWETQSAYEAHYATRLKDVTVLKTPEKFITLLNNTDTPENQKVIDSAKLLFKL